MTIGKGDRVPRNDVESTQKILPWGHLERNLVSKKINSNPGQNDPEEQIAREA